MTRILLILGVVLVAVGLLWPWGEPEQVQREAAQETLRFTTAGPVVGFTSEENTYTWLGIPFAAPPVGEMRWRRPLLPEPWSETRPALSFGAPCAQLSNPTAGVPGDDGEMVGSEDCLYLNVYAPQKSSTGDGELLPVMVWIHGGGNSIGSALTYDGSRLAGTQDVIVVTVHYRLGLFGWLSHPALRAVASGPEDNSGNFGTLDLIASLRWVQNNVASFGGDPDNVTIFGESAGGLNVFSLINSPMAEGLFHRAISQSGGTGTSNSDWAENYSDDPVVPGNPGSSSEVVVKLLQTKGMASNRDEAKAQVAGMDDAAIRELLYQASPLELYSGMENFGSMLKFPNMYRDGAVLGSEPLFERLSDPASYNSVPLMTGTNKDEMKLFQFLDPRMVKVRWGLFPTIIDPDRYEWSNRYFSDVWKAMAVDEVANEIGTAGPVYAYRWDWDEGASNFFIDYGTMLGAAHFLEVPFVFGNLDVSMMPGLFDEGNRRAADDLSDAMMSYWAQFAATGDPGQGRKGELPRWQSWTDSQGAFMVLDTEAGGGLRLDSDGVTAAKLKQRIAEDPALQDPEKRCTLYAQFFHGDLHTRRYFNQAEYEAMGCATYPVEVLAREAF